MSCDCNTLNYECPGIAVSSNCVIWQGEPIPLFGICPGDPITYVEGQIIEKINDLLAAEQKSLEDFDMTTCPQLVSLLAGKDKTLSNLLQVLWNYDCTLKDAIDKLDIKLSAALSKPAYPFQAGCITPVPTGTANDTDSFVQGLIDKVCQLQDKVNNIAPSVETLIKDIVGDVLSSMIGSLGNWGLQKTGSGADTRYTIMAMVPPMGAVAYFGPATNFDAAGKGLAATPYEGWYLISGLNGLPDARARNLVAAISGIPGGTLDNAVDPGRPENPGTNYKSGDKYGESFHKLTISEMPNHNHPLTDPGHAHTYRGYSSEGRPCGSKCDREDKPTDSKTTSTAYTGISIAGAGGSGYHENRPPSLVITGWIVRIN